MKPMLVLAFAAGLVGLLAWTSRGGEPSPVVDEAAAALRQGALLVDVRTPAEYRSGHPDGAVNVPIDQLPARLSVLGAPTRPLVVYCETGARSGSAAAWLSGRGFTSVINVRTVGGARAAVAAAAAAAGTSG